MSRSEWASSSSFQPVNADSLVNNPPCVEAVLYRWRVKSLVRIRRLLPGNQYRLLHKEHLDRLASRVNYCARRFSCGSVITHEYVIAFANEQLYRREAWDRYVDWHRDCLHEEGLLDSQIPDFKWFLWAEWQVDCGGQVEVEVDCGGQHNWCIRPAQTRRLDLSAVVSFR